MKKNSAETKKAQFMVENAMDDITRATRKVLMDYICEMYFVPLAKAIAYLEIDDFEADALLEYLDSDTRAMIIKCSKGFEKHEECVISEVEHIITTSGMNLDEYYQIIKENLIQTGQTFAEISLDKFRSDTPLFQKQLNECIFNFEDLVMLDDRAIQKILRETDPMELSKALKGTTTEVQDKIFRNMSVRAAIMLKEDMEFMGPVYEFDVKAAQSNIFKIIFRLEEKGEIVIARFTVGKLID